MTTAAPDRSPRMQFAFSRNKDVWAGVMLITTGAVAIFMAHDYAMGTTLRMGPGYFPLILPRKSMQR